MCNSLVYQREGCAGSGVAVPCSALQLRGALSLSPFLLPVGAAGLGFWSNLVLSSSGKQCGCSMASRWEHMSSVPLQPRAALW